ncbi:MAG TPA: gliding motility-associated ABC transporter substrate-binding protein GldG [Bacteroidetes bacterium]|nr:gliding motility-associated ABC transporter substrate-binding protein GldG [Bacteroidota bacterium]
MKNSNTKNKNLIRFTLLVILLIIINVFSYEYFLKLDLTKEKRHSISNATIKLLEHLDDDVYIEVYLDGKLPAKYMRLRNSAEDLLESFKPHIKTSFNFEFKDPFEGLSKKEKMNLSRELYQKGLTPVPIPVNDENPNEKKVILPGAIVRYKGKELSVQILQGEIAISQSQAIENSISKLEYNFASTIRRLNQKRKPRIGFIHGHGEWPELMVMDFAKSLSLYYDIERIDLPGLLRISKAFDAIIVASPSKAFNEYEKFKIDQYIMNGGKSLWLINAVNASMDSLGGEAAFLANRNELNLEDLFFNYGVRLNPDIIQDMHCAPHPFITGFVGEVPQQDLLDWYYYPVVIPKSKHPIVNNMDAVLFRFTGSIDTVGTSELKKTILLSSSQYSRLYQAPARVNLGILKNPPPAKMFNKPNLNLAVLVEGSFNSLYANRANEKFVKMLQDSVGLKYKATGNKTSMIFISDGDIIRNDTTRQGDLFPLGFYKYTRQSFANLDLLTNAVDFLCDSSGLVSLNAKNIQLRPLNTPKIKLESKKWKTINLVIPIILIIIFGIVYNFRRIRKYTGKI